MFVMNVKAADSNSPLSPDVERYVRKLDSTKLKGLQNELLVLLGMPVVITSNVSVLRHGVANGTEGRLVGIIHDPEVQIQQMVKVLTYGTGADTFLEYPLNLPNKLAKCLLIKVDNGKFQFSGLPPGVFPLFPTSSYVRIKIPTNRFARVVVESFPLSPMFSCTGHKTQAKTMPSLIIGNVSGVGPGWLYVVLSRTRSLGGIYLAEIVKLQDLQKAGPSADQLAEIKRLYQHHEQTLDQVEIAVAPDISNQSHGNFIESQKIQGVPINNCQEMHSRQVRSRLDSTWPPVSAQQTTYSWLFVPILNEIFQTDKYRQQRENICLHFSSFQTVIEGYRTAFQRLDIGVDSVHFDPAGYVDATQQTNLLIDVHNIGAEFVALLQEFGHNTHKMALQLQ
jgi:hypothetical protein